MKRILQILAAALSLFVISESSSTALAQGTAFTYQGQLYSNGGLANGSFDFQFILFTTNQSGLPASQILTNADVPVTNGLFITSLDFGSVFTGANYWLDINVRTNGNGTFQDLSPRQAITPTPYAVTAANLSGVLANNTFGISNCVVAGGLQNQAFGQNSTISGGYQNLISAASVNGTIAGGQANIVISPDSSIGGGEFNKEGLNTYFGTIGGGGYNTIGTNSSSTTISGGYDNTISDNTLDSTIGGGSYNFIGTNSPFSTIAGGRANAIGSNGFANTIGGGYYNNSIGDYATVAGGDSSTSSGPYTTVGGGYYNSSVGVATTISGGNNNTAESNGSVIGGGSQNLSGSSFSTVGGGYNNSNAAYCGTIPGGYENFAIGDYSFAAGNGAQANHNGTFVWSDDSSASPFSSASQNEFAIRATGGARFVTGGTGMKLDGQPVLTSSALANVAMLNSSLNTFAGDLSMAGGAAYHHIQLGGGNSAGYLYGSYPKYGDGIHLGYNYYADASGGDNVINSGGGTSRISVGYGSIVLATGGTGLAPSYQNVVINGNSTAVTGTLAVNGLMVLTSDRNAKQDFASVSPSEMLNKVAQMPISEWSYKQDPAIRHVGPIAQDFYSIFNIGLDEKHIAPIDEGGVAFAAIQGLNQKVDVENEKSGARIQKLEAENAELKQQNDSMAKQLAALAEEVRSLEHGN